MSVLAWARGCRLGALQQQHKAGLGAGGLASAHPAPRRSRPAACPPTRPPARRYLSGGRWRGSLPDSWAEPGAFPRLNLLTIASGGLNGTLPAAWGRVGAWPALQKLYLEGNQLQGQLPPEWGTPGAFPKLQLL